VVRKERAEIESIPAPGGPAGMRLRVPREEMLRALGLE
jgi:hypothetical protein